MAEYRIGRQRTKARQQRTVMINLSLERRVYDRLVAMAAALQREIGPYHEVTVSSIVRRILYQHPALRTLVKPNAQHAEPHDDHQDADGNSLVR
jgi:hypothetical protein